jgi:hypothetical protein
MEEDMPFTLVPGENCSNAAILNAFDRSGLKCTEDKQISDRPRILDEKRQVVAEGIADCLRVANNRLPRVKPGAYTAS